MPNEKILVVEDEGIVAEDIKLSLQRLGFVVPATAASGEEAIRKTEEHNPDLVLMDIVLQGEIDGIDAANQICSRFNIPIVYLTAYADEGMLERAKITEPIGYILKPYNEKELHATIEMALYQYKTGRRRRELVYTTIFESAPDAIVISDSAGKILLANAQTDKIFGYNRGELPGKTVEILIPERLREAHLKKRADYYSSPRIRLMGAGLDLYGRRKDGSEFPADICLSPINTGKGLSVIAIIRDITDRKEAERTLRESEQKFRALIEKSSDGVVMLDVNGFIRYASPSVTRILGYAPDELVGRSAFDLVYPDDLHQVKELFGRLVENPAEIATAQVRYKHKDGSWRRLDGIGTNLLAESGVQAIVGNFSDITERKRAEEALLRSYNLLNAVTEGTTDAIFVKDIQGRYLMINSAGARLIGKTVEEVIGKDDTELFSPDAGSKIMEDDRRIMSSGETRTYEEELLAITGIKRVYLTTKLPYCDHQGNVIGIIGIARDITGRKQAEEQVHHLAYYDLLTNLPNRLSFRDSIDRAITSARTENRAFALLIVNLNRFKEINDTLGHQNGDIILQQIGERLQGALQEAGTIARIGGDEFAVLMSNVDVGDATQIAGKIMERLEEPFAIEGLSLDISASIGISLFPGHGEDADTLLRRTDIAMHEAKRAESGYAIYSHEYDHYSQSRLALIGELRHAINSNQLFLLYQPKIDLRTGRTIGVESLVRWQHPKSGIIPPDQFISLSEKSGLIRQLTFWVLRESLRQCRSWHLAGLDVSIAVNLSIRSLQTPLLLDQIKGLFATWGVDPGRLRFEITESIIMADPELAMEIITQLTLMGIRFSIDDFGTGYSSLRYLQRLPVDEIKIDKSFIMNMMEDENNMKIVRSTIELGHSLGYNVTAEGVESQEIMERLASLGCDQAQGYFISRPILQGELIAWLGKQGQRPKETN